MSNDARAHWLATEVCQAVGCDKPRRTVIALHLVGLDVTALCPTHYMRVARAYKGRNVGRSKWTAQAKDEALIAAVVAAIGWEPGGVDGAAA
jgi:hypothetical protein